MKDQNNLLKGLLFALLTAITSGIAIFYSKISVGRIDPLVLASGRNLYVGAIFFIGLLIIGKINEIKKLSGQQWLSLIAIGLIGGSIPFYLFFTALRITEAQTANMIHKSLFIWATLLATIFLKEKLNPLYILSYALVIIGNFYFMSARFTFGKEELMIMAATLMWAAENIIAKKALTKISSELVGLFRMGIGALVLLGLTVVNGKGHMLVTLTPGELMTVFVGASILVFYVYFWYKALRYAPVSLVALVLTLAVVVGNILNQSFAGVKLLPKDIYSSILIASGVILIYIRPAKSHG